MPISPNKILDVYIEPDKLPATKGSAQYESHPTKLSIPDIYHPEYAAGALKRLREITRVVDLGSYIDEAKLQHYVIKALYDAATVTDVAALTQTVNTVIYSAGIKGLHL